MEFGTTDFRSCVLSTRISVAKYSEWKNTEIPASPIVCYEVVRNFEFNKLILILLLNPKTIWTHTHILVQIVLEPMKQKFSGNFFSMSIPFFPDM